MQRQESADCRVAATVTKFKGQSRQLLFGAILFSTWACSGNLGNVPTQHVVQFDRRGVLVEPTRVKAAGRADEVQRVPILRGATKEADATTYAEDIVDGLKRHAADNCVDSTRECRILIFIHGGLNSNRAAMRRAMQLLCKNWKKTRSEDCDLLGPIFKDKWAYPIFVNWNSGLVSSYRDHLTRVQRGRDIGGWGLPGAPFKLGADIARAAGRLPIVDYEMLSHDYKTVPGQRKRTTVERDAEGYFEALEEAHHTSRDDNSSVSRCRSKSSRGQRAHNFAMYWPSLPFKLVLAPLIDTLGTVSWDVMLRRTDLLFEKEMFCAKDKYRCAYELVAKPPLERVRAGGLAQILDHLRAFVNKRDVSWEITLIGHSMGAIITNTILNRYLDLPIRNIVYLASASTVKDYKASAFPFLEENKEARVFHLVLHPTAELRERFKWTDWKVIDLAPRGSLLLWIDNFLSKPNSLEERTAGRFANITRAMASTPRGLKSRISLTVFGVGKKVGSGQPQKHGEFADPRILEFWREQSWLQDFCADPGCQPKPAVCGMS